METRSQKAAFLMGAVLCLLPLACGNGAEEGVTCTQDRDCQSGLACISGMCKKPAAVPDVGGVKDGGYATDAGPAGDAGAIDDASSDTGAGGDAGLEDAGVDDAGQGDAGSPADAGVTADAGADTGTVHADTGQPTDTGAPADAGPADAGAADGGGGDAGGDAGGTGIFMVMTINLKHPLFSDIDGAKDRLQLVADGIDSRQPDVVALQEVVRESGGQSFAELLGGMTGYQWFFEFAYNVPTQFDEGLGILSRWPIVWTEAAELPHLDLVLFRRKVLGGRVDSPLGQIQLFCTHMTTDSDETVKADQALAVYRFIQANPSSLPGFLAGDLNAEPDTLAMRFYRGEAQHQGVSANFTDSWATANPGDEGFTMTSSNPTKRIDYIYMIPGQAMSAEVVSCELMFTEPVGGLYASDHIGVFCEYKIQ